MQREFLVLDDYGVTSVISALVPDNVVDLFAQKIGCFSLALIPPLGSQEGNGGHERSPFIKKGYREDLSLGKYVTLGQRRLIDGLDGPIKRNIEFAIALLGGQPFRKRSREGGDDSMIL